VAYIGLSKGQSANMFRSQRVEKRLSLAGAKSLRSRTKPCESPGPHVLGHVHGVGAAAGASDHAEEGHLRALRKENFMRYRREQEALKTRVKPHRRPATSNRSPPCRCGLAAWAAASRTHLCLLLAKQSHYKIPSSHMGTGGGIGARLSRIPNSFHIRYFQAIARRSTTSWRFVMAQRAR